MPQQWTDDNSTWEDTVAAAQSRTISWALGTLRPKEELILRLRYGIGKPLSIKTRHNRTAVGLALIDVADLFGISRERVYQIEKKALRKLKHPSRSRPLRTFLDP